MVLRNAAHSEFPLIKDSLIVLEAVRYMLPYSKFMCLTVLKKVCLPKSAKLFLALILIFVGASAGQAQFSSIALSGRVSGFVGIAAAQNAQVLGGEASIVPTANGHTLAISLNGSGSQPTEIRVPVQIRSNIGYTLSASAKLNGVSQSRLLVTSARSTGRFAAPDVIEALHIGDLFDARADAGMFQLAGINSASLDLSSPVTLLSGSRVSLAGTLSSPDNALEVIINFIVTPPRGSQRWSADLLLSVAPQAASL